jgi:hypothetical protein
MGKRVRPYRFGDSGAAGDRRTIRPAPCRSSRVPSAVRNIGLSQHSPMVRSIVRAVTFRELAPLAIGHAHEGNVDVMEARAAGAVVVERDPPAERHRAALPRPDGAR